MPKTEFTQKTHKTFTRGLDKQTQTVYNSKRKSKSNAERGVFDDECSRSIITDTGDNFTRKAYYLTGHTETSL